MSKGAALLTGLKIRPTSRECDSNLLAMLLMMVSAPLVSAPNIHTRLVAACVTARRSEFRPGERKVFRTKTGFGNLVGSELLTIAFVVWQGTVLVEAGGVLPLSCPSKPIFEPSAVKFVISMKAPPPRPRY